MTRRDLEELALLGLAAAAACVLRAAAVAALDALPRAASLCRWGS